jgi:hypothetical protein
MSMAASAAGRRRNPAASQNDQRTGNHGLPDGNTDAANLACSDKCEHTQEHEDGQIHGIQASPGLKATQ